MLYVSKIYSMPYPLVVVMGMRRLCDKLCKAGRQVSKILTREDECPPQIRMAYPEILETTDCVSGYFAGRDYENKAEALLVAVCSSF